MLDEAIEVGRQAVTATPVDNPGRGGFAANLGNALQSRFERAMNLADLDESIRLARSDQPACHWFAGPFVSLLSTLRWRWYTSVEPPW
jgi:hypothetical protein